ncbi:hypothetical protein, partial [Rubripirellula obstinata]|uniref:hypothetical protein n=1 Tax=Rubripirellula obstinata TaxID=406547 RepID=UPI001EE48A5A
NCKMNTEKCKLTSKYRFPRIFNLQCSFCNLQFAMFDWFANNITHRIFISPGTAVTRWKLATAYIWRSFRGVVVLFFRDTTGPPRLTLHRSY